MQLKRNHHVKIKKVQTSVLTLISLFSPSSFTIIPNFKKGIQKSVFKSISLFFFLLNYTLHSPLSPPSISLTLQKVNCRHFCSEISTLRTTHQGNETESSSTISSCSRLRCSTLKRRFSTRTKFSRWYR